MFIYIYIYRCMLTGLPKTAVPLSSIEAEWVLEQPWLAKRHRQALGYAVAPGLADGGPPPPMLVGLLVP